MEKEYNNCQKVLLFCFSRFDSDSCFFNVQAILNGYYEALIVGDDGRCNKNSKRIIAEIDLRKFKESEICKNFSIEEKISFLKELFESFFSDESFEEKLNYSGYLLEDKESFGNFVFFKKLKIKEEPDFYLVCERKVDWCFPGDTSWNDYWRTVEEIGEDFDPMEMHCKIKVKLHQYAFISPEAVPKFKSWKIG